MTQQCRSCGCSNLSACEGGCWWFEDDLCSSCVQPLEPTSADLIRKGMDELLARLPEGTEIL